MKRLVFILLFMPLLVFSQVVPTKTLRIANATTALGKNIAKGDLVFNLATNQLFLAKAAVASTYTLTTAAASLQLSTVTNNNQLTNGAGYITDGNTGWNNSYGFITDGNTGWNNTYGFLDATHITLHPRPTNRDDRNEPVFTHNTAFNKNFGTGSFEVCMGNDSRLSNARPASDVYAWAKASTPAALAPSEGPKYVVTEGSGELVDEVVIGSNPSGDLGGTWSNISVDDDSHNHTKSELVSSSSTSGHYSGATTYFQGHPATAFLPVYINGINTISGADAANDAKSPCIGITIGSQGQVLLNGFYTNSSWSFTAGDRIYLAAGGGITTSAPATTGNIIQVLGVAIDATTAYFTFDNTIVEVK